MARALAVGLTEYSTPAGGCLLTEDAFASKAKDLFVHEDRPSTKDMELLALGRHFRVGARTKIILGRNELENLQLEGHAQQGYTCIRPQFAGPAALLVGRWSEEARDTAVALIVRHTKAERLPQVPLGFWVDGTAWTTDRTGLAGEAQPVEVVKL